MQGSSAASYEFDEKLLLKQEIRVGDNVQLLIKDAYSSRPDLYSGVVTQILPFNENNPAVEVMYIENSYSDFQIKRRIITNSSDESAKIIKTDAGFLPFTKESAIDIFHSIVLGSYQQWMRDPYEVVVNGRVKVSKNYTYDPTGAAYADTGINVPNNATWDSNHNVGQYPMEYRTVPGYGAVPAGEMNGGSTATGGCDILYRKDPTQTFTGVARRFGHCADGLGGGPRARDWVNAASFAGWGISAADLLLPPVGVAA